MSEKPIIFTPDNAQKVHMGLKTQTRRVFAANLTVSGPNPPGLTFDVRRYDEWVGAFGPDGRGNATNLAPIQVGDRLWVREAHAIMSTDDESVSVAYRGRMPAGKKMAPTDGGVDVIRPEDAWVVRWAEQRIDCERWRPSLFMPRWASRTILEVTAVKAERLQDISEEDARAEGVLWVPGHGDITLAELNADPGYSMYLNCREGFEVLWSTIHKRDSPSGWNTNPWVWAYEFKRLING